MNIIFQDIDGPLIPLRMYYGGSRPFNFQTGSFVYDPVAVGMLNNLCEKFNARVVFNSAHNENPHDRMKHQGTVNGLKYLHDDCKTDFNILITQGRLASIEDWVERNTIQGKWIVIDDIVVDKPNQVLVDYNVGMTIDNYYRACHLFGEKVSTIVGIGQQNPNNYQE